uniref:Teratocyte protein I n=1 Tax=Cotesia flavipes TaxID=89805 RepID=A0A8K1YTT7_COTFL|nr:teratocyte protein I [Cotesia flavipes]
MSKYLLIALVIAMSIVAITAECGGLWANCNSDCDCCSLSCGGFGCKAAQIFNPFGRDKYYYCSPKVCDCWPTNSKVHIY